MKAAAPFSIFFHHIAVQRTFKPRLLFHPQPPQFLLPSHKTRQTTSLCACAPELHTASISHTDSASSEFVVCSAMATESFDFQVRRNSALHASIRFCELCSLSPLLTIACAGRNQPTALLARQHRLLQQGMSSDRPPRPCRSALTSSCAGNLLARAHLQFV